MGKTVLRLENVYKTYIIGRRKNAWRALKGNQLLQARCDRDLARGRISEAQEQALARAQQLFAAERYEESFREATGHQLKPRPEDRGTVVQALRGIDLQIEAGELVAVMGPSGSGKSTLLNLLGLLDTPSSGRISVGGRRASNLRPRELPDIRSHQLGFVFQSFNLISTLTALENVMLPLRYAGVKLRERRILAQEALEQVGLGDRLHHSPTELSGGQQQRVAIARSIANHPAIVLGDELTGELDSTMTEEVMELLLRLNEQGQTFVIVTHNPEVARKCRRVIHMRDGRIDHMETAHEHHPDHLVRL
jgi:putative ABC transport system ATP-binding protein